MSPVSENKNTPKSIKTVLSQNKKSNSIKKRHTNKVRNLIMDIEKPKIQSPIARKPRVKRVLPNQLTIPALFKDMKHTDDASNN